MHINIVMEVSYVDELVEFTPDVFLVSMHLNQEPNTSDQSTEATEQVVQDWDCSLHAIEHRLEGWTKQLEASGADIASLASSLRNPLRPLLISQKTVIWLNEVPEYDSWDFTPIILVSASSSSSNFQHRTSSEFSWNYISGAGDDEESWARVLTPKLFWDHAYDIIKLGPDLCNQKVTNIVEKDIVYRAQRGENARQLPVKPTKFSLSNGHLSVEEPKVEFVIPAIESNAKSTSDGCSIFWLGSTNLAVGVTRLGIVCYWVSLSVRMLLFLCLLDLILMQTFHLIPS